MRPRASTVTPGASIDETALPTVFKWEGGGKDVFISGTFTDWKPIPMVRSPFRRCKLLDYDSCIQFFCSFQDGVMVLSATHRYRKKYVTTLLYKPI
ncbi:5'-AMP-activated protein kinase subunit beta-1-like [Centruroides sculpturatus]|uniref:5'-AMP-activated protein kinase subunit beta-1-like n=1 Tax=Centruroides sculpturatus TaxID=218467 RepID=UPI000C6E8031|nr:5'-AMP-activated protein kinase subunit beta-1-like [Centruroides sculpturatus]